MVRFKNRWLLLHVYTPPSASSAPAWGPSSIVRALRHSLARNFGHVGAGALSGSVACRYAQPRTGVAIVRCGRSGAQQVRAAAALVTSMEGKPVRICVSWCGGTIKKVQLQCISLSRRKLLAMQAQRAAQLRAQAASSAHVLAAQAGQGSTAAAAAAAAPEQVMEPTDVEQERLDVEGMKELELCKAEVALIKQ